MGFHFLNRSLGVASPRVHAAVRWGLFQQKPALKNNSDTSIRLFASKKVRPPVFSPSLSVLVLTLLPNTKQPLIIKYSFLVAFFLLIFIHSQHKNLLKHTKGFRGRAKNCFSIAIRRLQKSWQYAYRDRRNKKREWHRLWIQRISAGTRQYSLNYSQFLHLYRKTGMRMDRKILAELAANEPFAFRSVVQVVGKQKQQTKIGS